MVKYHFSKVQRLTVAVQTYFIQESHAVAEKPHYVIVKFNVHGIKIYSGIARFSMW